MPLRIKLPSGERVLINGAVIENTGDTSTLVIHNRADILRRKEIMQEYEANTPARRVYFALQNAYVFKEDRQRLLDIALDLMDQYLQAAASAQKIVEAIRQHMKDEKFYDALCRSRKLIDHETVRLQAYENATQQKQEV